jgi:phospholipase C
MHPRPSRRDVLKVGAAAGGVLATRGISPALMQALAATQPVCGSIGDIEHIVIFVQENRSFDHYFGRYKGVRGYDDRSVRMSAGDDGTTVFKQAYPAGGIPGAPNPLLPFHIATAPPSAQQGECTNDIGHQWADQHAMWNHGSLDRWVARHLISDPGGAGKFAAITMGYYDGSAARDHSGDVDLYWALADNFTICDNFYCSVIGGTDINRLYSMTGTGDPDCWDGGGQFLDTQTGTIQSPGFDLGSVTRAWKPYPELLQGAGISWKVYGTPDAHLGDNVLRYFPQYRPIGGTPALTLNAFGSNAFPLDFAADALAGNLPQVSWVLGSLVDTEHAPAPIEWGMDDAEKVVMALLNSPLWPKTALVITYDENGGFFDHVPPPVPNGSDPAQRAGEFFDVSKLGATALSNGGTFVDQAVGLGFRVPALVISPFSRNPNPAGGPLVCSDTLDLTSTLRFVERVFGVKVPRRDATNRIPGLSAWREQNTGDMTTAFNFVATPNTSAPTLPLTNRADPRVLTECPAPTGTLVSPSFSAGYPVPGTAAMPAQEPLPAAVQRPSGPVTAAQCATANGTGSGPPVPSAGAHIDTNGLWAIAAGVAAVAALLLRRGRPKAD